MLTRIDTFGQWLSDALEHAYYLIKKRLAAWKTAWKLSWWTREVSGSENGKRGGDGRREKNKGSMCALGKGNTGQRMRIQAMQKRSMRACYDRGTKGT